MRDYDQVIKERYEKEDLQKESIYSLLNSVGFYGNIKHFDIIRRFINLIIEKEGKQKKEIKILDCGCGKGVITRFIAEFLNNPKQVYGMELSDNRLNYCKKMNASIVFNKVDVCKSEEMNTIFGEVGFNGIVSFCVLSHIRKKEDIEIALKNIFDILDDDGYFLWYDIASKNHFDNLDGDTQGYSLNEMNSFAENVGFKKVSVEKVFKHSKRFKVNTYYQKKEKNQLLMDFIDKFIPFNSMYYSVIYKK